MLIVSPHLDDAAMSLGEMVTGHAGTVRVLTVCAGIPPAGTATAYDRESGFADSVTAMQARREEDRAAWAVIGNATPLHLNVLDRQYGPGFDPEAVGRAIRAAATFGREHVCVPLGIGHPDHWGVADAARALDVPELIAYEELPYKVLWPETVAHALSRWEACGWKVQPHRFNGQGDKRRKLAALAQYRSQLGTEQQIAARHELFVPERTWRMVRA